MVNRRVGSVHLIQFYMLEYNLTQTEHHFATVKKAPQAVTNPQNGTGTQLSWLKVFERLPSTWILTPVKDKRPLRDNWQHESPLARDELLKLMQQGQKLKGKNGKQWHCHWTGIGLRLGTISNGLLAIDCDGQEAITYLQKLSNDDIPNTVIWTSGKEGRGQLLFQIPSEYWDKIKTLKIDCGDGQFLEFRWDGCQSVLPPSRHPDTGQYHWVKSPEEVEVATAPDWLIKFLLPQKQQKPCSQTTLPIQNTSHRNNQWTDLDWARSYLEALSSDKAENYDQWVQVGMALHSISEELLLDWDYWSRQSSKYQPGDCEKKWRSFKDTGGITIGSLATWAKEDGWKSPFLRRTINPSISKTNTATSTHFKATEKTMDGQEQVPLKEALTYLILKGLTGSDRTCAILNLSCQYHIPSNQIERYWKELEEEIESKQVSEETKTNLQSLLSTRNNRLNVHRIFPKKLADLMNNCADAMPGPVEGLAVTLLAAAASCAGTAAEVVVKKSSGYVQPCLLRTLLLAETGEMKTPLQKVVLDPLKRLEKEAFKTYQAESKDYEEAKAKGEAQNLKSPVRERYLLIDATPEKIVKIHAESTKGFLVHQDEWGSYLKGFNKYRNGQGNDRELDLSEFNGDTYIRDRVGDESLFIEKMAISRTSSYQTSLFNELVANREDLDGFLPRWLVAAPSFPPAYKNFVSDENEEVKQLQDYLYQIYHSLSQLIPQSYLLTLKAKQAFQVWQHHLVDLTLAETNLLMKAAYPKSEAYTARLALVLHLIEAISEGKNPEPVISGQTMEKAIYLAQYFLEQARWLYCPKTASASGLSGMMAQIQMFASKIGQAITARQVKQAISSVKNSAKASANFVRQLFTQLAEAGYGVLQGNGIHLRYEASTNQQNEISIQQNVDPTGLLTEAKNVALPHLQKSTSTFLVRVTLEGIKLEGQGQLAAEGFIQVTLASGLTISVPSCACEIVDDFVDVDENVAPSINTLEASPENAQSQNVDWLIENDEPENVDWESFPIEEGEQNEPILLARRVRNALLASQSYEQLNSILSGCQEFTDAVINWVLGNFLHSNELDHLEAIMVSTTSN